MDLYREAKSQPALPSLKKWSMADHSNLRRSRSTSAAHKVDSSGSKPQAWSQHTQQTRPMSSIPSRPESRASRPESRASRPSSRAASRLDSRPSSRMEFRTPGAQGKDHEPRPKSGNVRPLSGRVFMRRTSERGWVAKAYPEARGSSQTELEIDDDFSDVDSLDSFFDDDFDTEQQDEKLQNLLSCNTLGVESKGRKKDWVGGEVAIPQFHCPRCRDHWYGLTAYPCDDELARLIREGLWFTGKGDPANAGSGKRRSARNRNLHSAKKEFGSLSSESLTAANKRRGKKMEEVSSSRDPFSIGEDSIDGAKEKRKKRITFKLDDDVKEWRGGGGGGEDDGHSKRTEEGGTMGLSSTRQSGVDGSFGKDGPGGDTFLRGGNKGGKGGGARGMERSGEDNRGLSGTESSGRSRGGHDGNRGLESSDGSGSWDTRDPSRRNARGRRSGVNKEGQALSSGVDGQGGGDATGSGRDRLGQEINPRDGGHRLGGGSGLGRGREESHGTAALGTGSDSQSGLTSANAGGDASSTGDPTSKSGTDSCDTTASASHSRRGSLKSSSQAGKSGDGGDGGKGNQLGQEDHGKKVRKAVGYMRAVSPSGSEWGDPTHGRLYISSTATSSRAGSTSNLLRVQDEESKQGLTLPPLIPPITNKKPLIAPMLDRFEFTRAWTFSYHNSGPLRAKMHGH